MIKSGLEFRKDLQRPLELFLCPYQPGGLEITPRGCSKLWKKAQNFANHVIRKFDGTKILFDGSTLHHCVGCEIGKRNFVSVEGEEEE